MNSCIPNEDFGRPNQDLKGSFEVFASQTKILESVTKDEMRVFEVLFKAVSTGFGLRTIKKSIESQHFIFCSVFQNLRLGTIKLVDGA